MLKKDRNSAGLHHRDLEIEW